MKLSPSTTLLSLFLLTTTPTQTYASSITLDTTRTNQGPLTTAFSPPPSCTETRTRNYMDFWPKLEVGCEGPAGNECCPGGWRSNVYFSPGMCPTGYKGCTLATGKQRRETTNLCCPTDFDCATRIDADCKQSLNTRSTITYTDSGTVTSRRIYAVTATPIQIRFRAAESTIVPVPTESFNLPRGYLLTKEKVGIGIGVPVAVGLITAVLWYFCCFKKKQRRRGEEVQGDGVPLRDENASASGDDDAPPPYPGPKR
ncbi:hypothetical protein MW887_011857 [Aspergillus wentii]|nr:hypothetical protein MW887_011857 [Aspergillus wentii]